MFFALLLLQVLLFLECYSTRLQMDHSLMQVIGTGILLRSSVSTIPVLKSSVDTSTIVSIGCFSSFGVCELISRTSGIFCTLSSICGINSFVFICTELSEVSVFFGLISDVCDSSSIVCFISSMLSLWFAQVILFAFQIPATPLFEDSLQASFVFLSFQQELLALRLFEYLYAKHLWWSSLLLDFCYNIYCSNSSIGVAVGVIVCTPESSTSGVSSAIVCALKSSPVLAVCISSSKVIGIGSGEVCMNVERLSSSFGVSEVDTSHVSTAV
ncbi:hypothetical protein ALC53_07900 [Atta colombica]|uniref:Secreted protein n=1 Tax=Atta colombica TaxID=520822 RepID=A0A195BBE0_9HYME|nr:hypothetical protein ALC53_07900 [Atta colombica]